MYSAKIISVNRSHIPHALEYLVEYSKNDEFLENQIYTIYYPSDVNNVIQDHFLHLEKTEAIELELLNPPVNKMYYSDPSMRVKYNIKPIMETLKQELETGLISQEYYDLKLKEYRDTIINLI